MGSVIGDKRGGGDDGRMVCLGVERLELVWIFLVLIGIIVSVDFGFCLCRIWGGVLDGMLIGVVI